MRNIPRIAAPLGRTGASEKFGRFRAGPTICRCLPFSTRAAPGQAQAGRAARLAAAFDAIVSLDAEGRITEPNPATERLFDRPLEDVLWREMADAFIAPGQREDYRRNAARLHSGADGFPLGERQSLRTLHADDTEFPVELVLTRCTEDQPCAFTGRVRDLTGRYAGENCLRMLEKSLGHANGAIVITEAAPVEVPEAFTTVIGYPLEEVLGKNPRFLQGPDTDPAATRKIHDVTERREKQQRLEEQVRLAVPGAEIGLTLTRHDLLADVLHRCADVLVRHLGAAFARVWTLNEATDVLELQASAGLYTHLDGPHSRVPVGRFKIGLITRERQPHLTNRVVGDPRVGDQEWAKQHGMVAFAGYPLIVEDRLVGVMALFSCKPLSQSAFQAMDAIANAMALGIQHRQAQAERSRLANELHLLLESISEGVCGLDLDGRLTFINRCGARMLGYPAGELVGRTMHPLVHHHRADGAPYALGDCPIDGSGRHGWEVRRDDEVFWRRDGTAIPVDDFCAPVIEGGQTRGSVVTFTDITARKEAEVALRAAKRNAEEAQSEVERANCAKSEFLSRMSHELRTPLNAILDFGQLLELDAPTDRQRDMFSHILRGGKHLPDLINEVLDIARKAMGGAIGVDSTVGRGSTFYVELPAALSSSTGQTAEPATNGLAADGPIVLYIEDNPSKHALVEQVLGMQRSTIRLLGAMLGQLGLDMAREHRPDLILLDLQLLVVAGDEVLRQLQAAPRTQGIPVIMVSADATVEQPCRLLELGARAFLTKPLKIAALMQMVDEVLAEASNRMSHKG